MRKVDSKIEFKYNEVKLLSDNTVQNIVRTIIDRTMNRWFEWRGCLVFFDRTMISDNENLQYPKFHCLSEKKDKTQTHYCRINHKT